VVEDFADDDAQDTTNPIAVAAVPFFQSKVDIVNYLKDITTSYPNLSWTALITGPFYGWVSPHPLHMFGD